MFLYSGKTLLLKERCIRTKRRNPGNKITMISLASTDVYGNPYDVPCVYNLLSEREMKHHQVTFMNAKQLRDDHMKYLQVMKKNGNHQSTIEGNNNLKFAYETCWKCFTSKEISVCERKKIFFNHGIDHSNAIEYYNSQRLKGPPAQNNVDILESLLEHIRRNPDTDYFIDECPILINTKCKLSLHYFPLNIIQLKYNAHLI